MGRSFLSEVERPSILRTGLPVAPSLIYRLATGLSAPAPAQRAGAQRLRALAQGSRSAFDRFLAHRSRSSCRPHGGGAPEVASRNFNARNRSFVADARSFKRRGCVGNETTFLPATAIPQENTFLCRSLQENSVRG